MTYWPLEDAPEERVVLPVADLGDWTPDYGPDGRAESALDDPGTRSLQFGEPRCAQCGHHGDDTVLYSWMFEGKPCYICRDSVACAERQNADEGDGEPEMLLARKEAVVIEMSEELLADLTFDSDLIGKIFRGEIKLKPPPEPKRHRCLACWLVSLLPGHERCKHGYLACDDCIWQD